MAHQQQVNFLESVKTKFEPHFKNCSVLDIGSLDINGNTRFLFENAKYIGIDVGEGPNVDFVCKGHEFVSDIKFDIVVSTECFEHDMYYRDTLRNCVNLLKPGGLFMFTCASTGRAEHGTRRTSPSDAPLLQGEWSDYYKNLTEADVREVLDIEKIFVDFEFTYEKTHKDLYFWGIKKSKPRIWTHIAWDDNEFGRRCMGSAYNDCLNQHDDNDWLAIIDHDAMFCCYDWYLQLQQAIMDNPKGKAFTCRVNRLASLRQMIPGVDPHNHDMTYHRKLGKRLAKAQWGKTSLHINPKEVGHYSGTFLCVHIGTMKHLGGFPYTGDTLGQDNLIHKKIVEGGHEFHVVNGIYIYHWYKADDPYPHSKKVIDMLEDEHFNSLKLT
jgi:SAM-dependent methyltransferase|tara:strand:+ start:344 stop:1489 length:1146 start_codon:yes stop_codon:yes gene_type:complete